MLIHAHKHLRLCGACLGDCVLAVGIPFIILTLYFHSIRITPQSAKVVHTNAHHHKSSKTGVFVVSSAHTVYAVAAGCVVGLAMMVLYKVKIAARARISV